MGLLRPGTQIVAERADLLPAAVAKVAAMMAEGFTPPAQPQLTYCGEAAYSEHIQRVDAAEAEGALDTGSAVVMREISSCARGGHGQPMGATERSHATVNQIPVT